MATQTADFRSIAHARRVRRARLGDLAATSPLYRALRIACLCALIAMAYGCATKMVVTPEIKVAKVQSDFRLLGHIQYEGNRDYLPRTIVESTDGASSTLLVYTHQSAYGRDKTPQAIPLYNPLTIVGFPIGDNTMVVNGKLEIRRGTDVLKEYSATCGMETCRNIFSEGDTFSQMRKKGLMAVRDNIEQQMCQDRQWLSTLDAAR
jgi:hypothetical protein